MNVDQVLRYLGFSPLLDYRLGEAVIFWLSSQPQPTAQQLADAELPAAKAFAIDANRAEARRRIEAKWPAPVQRSAALGVYPQATVDTMVANIAAVIAAENAAADLIDVATTVAEVEAVQPNWPVI